MIVNCFLLFNEIDLLKLRLSYEYDSYDRIVIIEGKKTFSGREKILYFQKYKHLFEKYLDKITYVVVDDIPEVIQKSYIGTFNRIAHEYRWHLEFHVRNCIKRGLEQLNLSDTDKIIINDIDEIVDISVAHQAAMNIQEGEIHYFLMKDYRGSIAQKPLTNNWPAGFISLYKHIKSADLTYMRGPLRYDLRKLILLYDLIKESKAGLKLFLSEISSYIKKPGGLSEPKELVDYRSAELLCQAMFPEDHSINDSSKLKLQKAGVKKAIFHENAGWHLSNMTGGYDKFLQLKTQSFSHSEWSYGDPLDPLTDFHELLSTFVAENKHKGNYKFDAFDPGIPSFIKQCIDDYCILLLPE